MELQLANENRLELVVSNSATSLQDLLDSQKQLFRDQINELENIVRTQCQLTGVNPLSEEMVSYVYIFNCDFSPSIIKIKVKEGFIIVFCTTYDYIYLFTKIIV